MTDHLAALRQLAADYARLRTTDDGMPLLELVALTTAPVTAPPHAPGVGWVREASDAFACEGGEALDRPLAGEWLDGENATLILRDGVPDPGKAAVWRIAHRPLGTDDGPQPGETAALRQRVAVMGARRHDDPGQTLTLETAKTIIIKDKDKARLPVLLHDIYWGFGPSGSGDLLRVACRFAGFAETQGHDILLPPPGAN